MRSAARMKYSTPFCGFRFETVPITGASCGIPSSAQVRARRSADGAKRARSTGEVNRVSARTQTPQRDPLERNAGGCEPFRSVPLLVRKDDSDVDAALGERCTEAEDPIRWTAEDGIVEDGEDVHVPAPADLVARRG